MEFQEDSEIESFEDYSFHEAKIRKLFIPPKLIYLKKAWCRKLENLTEIKISPSNRNFQYHNNQYLLGKPQEKPDEFSILYYAKNDLEEALVPSQVQIVNNWSFTMNTKLKTVIFPENSKLKVIKSDAFGYSSIQRLVLPASLEEISKGCFNYVKNLVKIEVSPKNKFFSVFDDKLLLKKCQEYDILVVACRNIENAAIPSQIQIIMSNAFEYCTNLQTLTFDSNSQLEEIQSCAFCNSQLPEKIIFPSSLKKIEYGAFKWTKKLKEVVFQSKEIQTGFESFSSCADLEKVSFPSSEKITIEYDSFSETSKNLKLIVRKEAEINEDGNNLKSQIEFINDERSPRKIASKTPPSPKKEEDDATNIYMKRIRYLEERLMKYEQVVPFDPEKEILQNKKTG